jgi:hypothetical protein
MDTTPTLERTTSATVLGALHHITSQLREEQKHLTWAATTNYTMLMVACYGPLFRWNPSSRRYEFQGARSQPAGTLETARALTARVVAELGGEHGATLQDVQAVIDRLTR